MKILFFSPHSAIWLHAFPEALVAEALKQEGNEILYVGCGGILNKYCISMSAYGLSLEIGLKEKKRVCDLCKKNKEILCSSFELESVDLSENIDAEDIEYAVDQVSNVTLENFLELIIDGVAVGRYALYECLLEFKKNSFSFSEKEWAWYTTNLLNSILVMRGMQKIFDEYRPDCVVSYNTIYSVNRTVAKFAESQNVVSFHMHAGGNLSNRLQTLILGAGNMFDFYKNLSRNWQEFECIPCTQKSLKLVTDHFLEVTRGRSFWAYSSASGGDCRDLRSFFVVGIEQKVICATLSSYDERFAAESVDVIPRDVATIFPKQVDWIKALVGFVSGRKDLKLIIRVHPREFPNKRESLLSDHAKMLQEVFSELPENVCVNWPTDDVSLYDLANIVDVFTNAWSSSGKEMAMLGIPVVLYSRDLVLYPPELNYVGETVPEYFQQLEQALQDGWSAERIRKVYRWCAMEYDSSLLDISESCSFTEYQQRSFAGKVANRILKTLAPYRKQKADCRNRAPHLKAAAQIDQIFRERLHSVLDTDVQRPVVSYEEETDNLKGELRRLVAGLYGVDETNVQPDSLADKLLAYANS